MRVQGIHIIKNSIIAVGTASTLQVLLSTKYQEVARVHSLAFRGATNVDLHSGSSILCHLTFTMYVPVGLSMGSLLEAGRAFMSVPCAHRLVQLPHH